jgi:uncharacterized protein involved in exopolysaccharide biosynthesis
MVVQQFMRILKARFGIITIIFLTTLAVTVAVSLVLTKKYQAATTLVFEIKGTDPVLGGAVMMPQTIQGYLVTQAEIIRSERVVNRVIDALGLEAHPVMLAVANDEGGDEGGLLRSRIKRHFDKKLAVDPSREGTTLTIAYEGTDPALTAAIVNGFARAYVETGLELKTEPARNFRLWFEAQSKDYRERLEEAQKKVSTAQRGASSMPEVVANPLLQTLSGDLGRVEARVKQLAARLGPAHPEYQAAQAELDQLRSRLQTEMARVGGSIAAGNDVNLRREAELRGLLEAQRGKVAGIKMARDRLQVLEREVQGSQRALDLVAQRFTETSLESQARQSNVSILTPASVPTMPSRPLPMLNALIGGLLGLFVAVLAALTLESMNRPVRTADDLSAACGVPVLAVVPQAATRRPQRLIGTSGPGAGLPPTLRLGN